MLYTCLCTIVIYMQGRRSTLREMVFKALYIADFNNISDSQKVKYIFDQITKDENIQQTREEEIYIKKTLEGTLAHRKDIDKMLSVVASDWPLEKMAMVDRNILRLGVFEILFGKDISVPQKVAISEAIELAKRYGGNASGSFVNGVLGTILRELKLPTEESLNSSKKMVGSFVFSMRGDIPYFALIRDMKNKWTVPKGKVLEKESFQDAVSRVTREEIGIEVSPLHQIGKNMYFTHTPEGTVRKDVTYFLSKGEYAPLNLKESNGLKEVGWFTVEEFNTLPTYKNVKEIFEGATKTVTSSLERENSENWKQYVDDLHKEDNASL